MWTTAALVAALASTLGQADQLTLNNVRATYGLLGSPRQDAKLLPGDSYFLAFDIDGVKVDEDGKVKYNMGMEVKNAQGKVVYGQEPRDLEAYNTLGGTSLPAFAHVIVGLDQPAGTYTMKVTVKDRASSATQTLERKFEVSGRDFGLVRLQVAADGNSPPQLPAAPVAAAGQNLWLHFIAVGFDRGSNKQPNVSVEMRILDDSGKPTTSKPFTGEITEKDQVAANVVALPMQFVLNLNRPGKFTVELQATDRVSKKTSKLSVPLTVVELK